MTDRIDTSAGVIGAIRFALRAIEQGRHFPEMAAVAGAAHNVIVALAAERDALLPLVTISHDHLLEMATALPEYQAVTAERDALDVERRAFEEQRDEWRNLAALIGHHLEQGATDEALALIKDCFEVGENPMGRVLFERDALREELDKIRNEVEDLRGFSEMARKKAREILGMNSD